MAEWNAILDEVMRQRGARLLAYATLLVGRSAAEDLVQDALIRTFTRERRFPHVNAAEAYVRRTMATMSIDQFRHRRTRQRSEHASALSEGAVARGDSPDFDTSIDVSVALATLAPRERTCVVLRFYDDLTVREISEVLGLAVGTVKRYLHDATRALETALGDRVDVSDAPRLRVSVTQQDHRHHKGVTP